MRPKPKVAKAEDVTIKRDGNYAVISFIDGSFTMNLGIGPKMKTMDDAAILRVYNETVQSIIDGAQSWQPTEIAEGHPQIKFNRRVHQWSAQGHVLRCFIESGDETDKPVIEIDDQKLSIEEFGAMLSHFTGWGMRIAFVSDDQLFDPPVPEIRNAPKPIAKREIEEIVAQEK